ncbi:MAG: DNA translocase FtsK 4TM domain-containing protein, partial [Parvularcula sp.]|nr:DNA translocase FtsK 4TM domain-containing protein [Parvularcula sp.]
MPRRPSAQKPDPREELRAALRRLVARAGGVSLMLAAAFVLISVMSFDISDPSWSTATGREAVANWGGGLGAALSDLTLQMLGGAVIPLLVVLALWGSDAVRFGTPEKTPRTAYLKALILPVGTVLFAAGLAAMPRSADWPFVVSFGGALGDGLLHALSGAFGAVFVPFPRMAAAALSFAGALAAFGFASGLRVVHLAAAADAVLYAVQAAGLGAEGALLRLRARLRPAADEEYAPEEEEDPVECLDAELLEGPSNAPAPYEIEDAEPLEEVIPRGIRPDKAPPE